MKVFRYFLVSLILISVTSTCFAEDNSSKGKKEEKKTKRIILNVLQAMEQAPDLEGQKIVVVGKFMGENGLCEKPAPMKGNNWMLQDDDGNCIFVRGLEPEGLSSRRRIGLGKNIAIESLVGQYEGKYFLYSLVGEDEAQQRKHDAEESFVNKKRVATVKAIYTVEDIFVKGEKFRGVGFYLKGMNPEDNKCAYPAPPVIDDPWAITDLKKNCLYVDGPRKCRSGEVEPGRILVIEAMLEEYEEEEGKSLYLKIIDRSESENEEIEKPKKEESNDDQQEESKENK